MPMHDVIIQTPLETMNSKLIDGKKPAFVPICARGMGVLDGLPHGRSRRRRAAQRPWSLHPKTLVAVENHFHAAQCPER